jgi:putative effector of murein hydrolase LrgA (UPF0299 family)
MIDWPLTPPTQLTLIISLLAAIFACLVHWLHLAVPPPESGFVVLVGLIAANASTTALRASGGSWLNKPAN